MQFANEQTDAAVLEELGGRIKQARLARDVKQASLAHEAGVHRNTVEKLESGNSTSLTSLIRVLRALELLPALEAALPAADEIQPIELLRRGAGRKRARGSATTPSPAQPWRWGDEDHDDDGDDGEQS